MEIVQGQSFALDLHLVGKITRNPINLTGATFFECCIPGTEAPVHLYYETIKGDVANASDLISNIAVTDHIQEGMEVSGLGIPVGAKVIKIPTSTLLPTAAGVVQISAPATAANMQTNLLFQNIFIATPSNGVVVVKGKPFHSKLAKVETLQTVELQYLDVDGETEIVQFTEYLTVKPSVCAVVS